MSWTLYPIGEFAALSPKWDELQRSCLNVAFLESSFLRPLLTEFGTGRELLALRQEGPRLAAAAIVFRTGTGHWQLFQPSQLPLGALICPRDADLDLLANALLRALPGLALMLSLTQLDDLLTPRPADGERLRMQSYIDTSWVTIAGDFDAYWEARGKNLKQNTKKQRNKVAAEGQSASLDCLTSADDVAQAIADYGSLESSGWKAADGTAIHPDNSQGRFYRQMLENFCAQGRGRIYRYRFGDKIVAMDLCVDNGPVVIILKTAYDESFKSLSPSTLMRQEEFKQFFDQGVYRRIEFYGKTMEWHTRWTDQARPVYHATAYRWAVLKRAHAWLRGDGSKEASAPETVAEAR